ncbi:type IV secretory system conjugative DNA transfer family protein [Carboxylicivirga marina]|uniref:Type IV secretory system conjugative DNA transfer family protein n=1 Tax=Carboxylicivirga marina TaxID=2800988 RepID=A0ABS1HKQ6_9BACT|nr:type IV secretory system conjugative DNA transfer family protein [Carboxylicivirga marina]MBK3518264.1 type IV secretory system conjugative DNA transfer family protein [Carboxylicivirga marina]
MSNSEGTQLIRLHEAFRFISYLLLFASLYLTCLHFFKTQGIYQNEFAVVIERLYRLPFLSDIIYSKLCTSLVLLITCLGTKARKEPDLSIAKIVLQILSGLLFYWTSIFLLPAYTLGYLLLSTTSFVMLNVGFDNVSKVINVNLMSDRFNQGNESFRQEEKLKTNPWSVNIPMQYIMHARGRQGWINVVNPFRASMVIGTPGSGKSFGVVQPFIRQHLYKGFSMGIYDFKYPDLSALAFAHYQRGKVNGLLPPHTQFCVINLDDINKSQRCNPLAPELMDSPIDAFEASRTILYNLNREWIRKQGEFFSESAVTFFAAVIWFLKRYEGGKFCTLPHAIELLQMDYDDLFEIMATEKDVVNIINPFINAHQRGASEQLEGQLGSLKIAISKIITPEIYWICSGNDFSLDLNNPESPKVLCLANNPLRIEIYGAVLSLFITRMLKVINKKGQRATSLIFDELPTIYFRGLDTLIATARSNKISTLLGIQTIDQLVRDYGKEAANAILTNIGNVFSGQATGDTAKYMQSRMGKVLQERQSLNINRATQSSTISTQLDYLVPEGKIATLPQGYMVGQVADSFGQPITRKNFNALLKPKDDAYKSESAMPDFYTFDSKDQVLECNRKQIYNDIQKIYHQIIHT